MDSAANFSKSRCSIRPSWSLFFLPKSLDVRTIPSRLLSDMLDDHEARESATGVNGSYLIERTQSNF